MPPRRERIDKEEVKRRLAVTTVLDVLGIEHNGQGENMLCPWHAENNPSCTVYEDHLYCHSGCGTKDIFDLWQVQRGEGFREALEALASEAGVSAPPSAASPVDPEDALRRWSANRKLDPRRLTDGAVWAGAVVAESPRKGAARAPALEFPTPCGARRLRFLVDGARPKTRWSRRGEGGPCWYGLGLAVALRGDGGGPVYVVNGEPSVWACYQSGVPAVCTCSTEDAARRSLEPILPELVATGAPLRIVYDRDDAGRRGAIRLRDALRAAGGADVLVLELPDSLPEKGDVDDLHRAAGDDGLAAALADLPELTKAPSRSPKRDRGGASGQVGGDERPKCLLVGDLERRTETVLKALADHNEPPVVFVNEGRLCHVMRDPDEASKIRHLSHWLEVREHLGRRFAFEVASDEGPTRAPAAPGDVCKNVVSRPPNLYPLPTLATIVRVPGFAADGTPLVSDGYAPAASAWVDLGGLQLPELPVRPSGGDVAAARELIGELIHDFPFASDGGASRANAIAMAVTMFARPLISGPTPLFFVSAPTQGTGKTKLVQTLTVVATGRSPNEMTPKRDDDKTDNAILAVLRQHPAVVLLDILPTRPMLDSPSLARVLTSCSYEGRELGHTRSLCLPNRAVWAATGNNPNMTTELTDRCVVVRMVPDRERPRDRPASDFLHELPAWAVDNRGRLATAFMVLVANWLAQGRPRGSARVGSFEEWSHVVSGILEAAGIEGLLANREAIFDEIDDEAPLWRPFCEAWWERFGDGDVTAGKLCEMAGEFVMLERVLGDKSPASRRKRMANGLKANNERTFGRFRILRGRRRDNHAKVNTYRLERVLAAVPGHAEHKSVAGVAGVAGVNSSPGARAGAGAHTGLRADSGGEGSTPATPASPTKQQELPGVGVRVLDSPHPHHTRTTPAGPRQRGVL